MIRKLILAAVAALVVAPAISLHYACAFVAQAPLHLPQQADDLQLIGLSPLLPGSLF